MFQMNEYRITGISFDILHTVTDLAETKKKSFDKKGVGLQINRLAVRERKSFLVQFFLY